MSWLHIPPALSCGNETAFDEAKPMFEIAQLGCAWRGFRCLRGARLQLNGKGETFPEGRECLQLPRFFSSSWGGRKALAQRDKCTLKDCARRLVRSPGLQGLHVLPLAGALTKITPCHVPKEEGG